MSCDVPVDASNIAYCDFNTDAALDDVMHQWSFFCVVYVCFGIFGYVVHIIVHPQLSIVFFYMKILENKKNVVLKTRDLCSVVLL